MGGEDALPAPALPTVAEQQVEPTPLQVRLHLPIDQRMNRTPTKKVRPTTS